MPTLPRSPRVDTRHQPSWQARAIAELVRQAPIGEVLSYPAFKEATGGVDIQKKRWYLETARTILEREGIAIDCVTGVGYKRLPDQEIVQNAESRRKKTVRASTRNLKFVRCAKLEHLDTQAQTQALAYAALFTAIGALAHRKTLDFVLQNGTLPAPKPIQPAQLKGLFR